MNNKSKHSESAVSPVVGVMLMLVVTIIIAAVVAAFAGGLAETSSTAPQISMTADATYDESVDLYFKGGDTLSSKVIEIKTTPKTGDYVDMVSTVDLSKAILGSTGKPLIEEVEQPDTGFGVWYKTVYQSISTGDSVTIQWADAFTPSSYAPSSGDLLEIAIYDTSSGKPIVTKTVTVQ